MMSINPVPDYAATECSRWVREKLVLEKQGIPQNIQPGFILTAHGRNPTGTRLLRDWNLSVIYSDFRNHKALTSLRNDREQGFERHQVLLILCVFTLVFSLIIQAFYS